MNLRCRQIAGYHKISATKAPRVTAPCMNVPEAVNIIARMIVQTIYNIARTFSFSYFGSRIMHHLGEVWRRNWNLTNIRADIKNVIPSPKTNTTKIHVCGNICCHISQFYNLFFTLKFLW